MLILKFKLNLTSLKRSNILKAVIVDRKGRGTSRKDPLFKQAGIRTHFALNIFSQGTWGSINICRSFLKLRFLCDYIKGITSLPSSYAPIEREMLKKEDKRSCSFKRVLERQLFEKKYCYKGIFEMHLCVEVFRCLKLLLTIHRLL